MWLAMRSIRTIMTAQYQALSIIKILMITVTNYNHDSNGKKITTLLTISTFKIIIRVLVRNDY